MKKLYFLLILLLVISGCKTKNVNNYENPSYWLSIPDNITHNVDVFYLYPTVLSDPNVDIYSSADPELKKAAKMVETMQTSIFKNSANIFSPLYSQYSLKVFAYSNYEKMDKDIRSNSYAVKDINDALDYYFKYKNNNRPFILAGHSQGAAYILLILSEYMKKHPEYYKNMVAAYVLGCPVTEDFLKANPHLKFAESSNDTGVIVSFEVQSPNKAGVDIMKTEGRQVINPLNWKRDETYAGVEENKGSMNYDMTIITPGIADAKIDKKQGVIICSSVYNKTYEIKAPALFGTGSYHSNVINFYYKNLEENVQDRINAFFEKNK